MFFENTSEDEKKNFVKFYNICDIYNVTKNDVLCRLFILTLKINRSEWFYSLLPRTITSSDILENLFIRKNSQENIHILFS
jgi:hypothetical protein